jgi:hypothetical protein
LYGIDVHFYEIIISGTSAVGIVSLVDLFVVDNLKDMDDPMGSAHNRGGSSKTDLEIGFHPLL